GEGGALRRDERGADAFAGEALDAGAHLGPLLVVTRDLRRAVPAEVAVDTVPRDELAHELLIASREPPDAERVRLAVASRRDEEVLGDAREEEPGVPPAGGLRDRPRLEPERPGARPGEPVRGGSAGAARPDGDDVRARVVGG